jgi:aldehyde dehydrogenase (NAD+)
LAFGKFFNGGQTCVAPDYVLVHENVFEVFKAQMVKVLREFYGDITQYNDNVTHIINRRHFDRLLAAIQNSGGSVIAEGFRDPERLYIGPTLIDSPALDSAVMTDEIFGPVLPFVKVSGPEQAIDFINAREKPLALYVLTENSRIFDLFAKRTSSGAVMMNDCTFHVSSPMCPFGGVGNSGMGQYHGKAGIRALSHMKPVVSHGTLIDLSMRYPPYTAEHLSLVEKFA